MSPSPPRPEPPEDVLVEVGRDRRGRLRRLRLRRLPLRPALPLWVRVGLASPKLEWTLTLVACACALGGGVLLAALFLPGGLR